jgi:hypothetical protein
MRILFITCYLPFVKESAPQIKAKELNLLVKVKKK